MEGRKDLESLLELCAAHVSKSQLKEYHTLYSGWRKLTMLKEKDCIGAPLADPWF